MLIGILAIGTKAGAQAQPTVRQERARFTFADGGVSFLAPPGFTALTPEEIAVVFPRQGAPRHAVGNARRTSTIAYDLLDQKAPSNNLDELRQALMKNFVQLPKIKWVANEVRRIGNRDWAYLEFTALLTDRGVHNIVLLSVHNRRLLLFNFNSNVVEFPRLERALRASMATISTTP
jgi:hypothetical protein